MISVGSLAGIAAAFEQQAVLGMADARVRHAEGFEDALGEQPLVGQAAGSFEDQAEELVSEV